MVLVVFGGGGCLGLVVAEDCIPLTMIHIIDIILMNEILE